MKTIENTGVSGWAAFAQRMTLNAANTKDYKLRRKIDKQMKEVAQNLAKGRGYIIATDKELEARYPGLFKATGVESKKMIWAIEFIQYAHGNKMAFCPVR